MERTPKERILMLMKLIQSCQWLPFTGKLDEAQHVLRLMLADAWREDKC